MAFARNVQINYIVTRIGIKNRQSKMIYLFGVCFVLVTGIALYVHLGPKLPDMQEGMWKITAESKMPGTMRRTPITCSQCLTKDNYVPQISIPGYECRMQRRKHPSHVLGNHVFWKVQCEGPGTIQGAGHIKYSGDTVKGKIQMRTVEDEDGQKRFDTYISGFRTGACGS